jgi:hypothetical protein
LGRCVGIVAAGGEETGEAGEEGHRPGIAEARIVAQGAVPCKRARAR